jgi:crossover junction endodeoxyribonuclease RuvC
MYFVGVDPGIAGAIAILDEHGFISELMDTPTVRVGRKSKRELQVRAFYDVLQPYGDLGARGAVEKVGPMPGQGVTSMFNFGGAYWAAQALMTATGVSYELVTPVAWKKEYGLVKKDKDEARAVAYRLFPDADLPHKKDVNKADALLIARWVYLRHKQHIPRRKLKR